MRLGIIGALAAMSLGLGRAVQPSHAEPTQVVRTEPRRPKPDKRQRERAKAERELRSRVHVQAPETRQVRRARERRERKNDRPRCRQVGEN